MNPVEFNAYRTKMNEQILEADNLIIKRIFNLDTNAYAEGVLDVKQRKWLAPPARWFWLRWLCEIPLRKVQEVGFNTKEVHEVIGGPP